MSITVRFFASIRERLGKGEAVIDAGDIRTVADVWVRAAEFLPARLLAAVNLEHARLESPVRDGDEVGFFPPVTAGRYEQGRAHARSAGWTACRQPPQRDYIQRWTRGGVGETDMKIRVTDVPFDPWREVENHRRVHPALAGDCGATTVFVGTMRRCQPGRAGDRHDARALPRHDGEATGGNLPRGGGALGDSRHPGGAPLRRA